jgi:hypothetical protein
VLIHSSNEDAKCAAMHKTGPGRHARDMPTSSTNVGWSEADLVPACR